MVRKCFVILLLAAGVIAWARLSHSTQSSSSPTLRTVRNATPLQWILLAGCCAIALIPSTAQHLAAQLDRFRGPSRAGRAGFAVLLAAVSLVYLIATAFRQHRELYPRFHDDQMYLLQMRLLSCLRLWTAPPATPDFFDTFHTLVKPVYASIYFPGTAMLYVAELWMHAPLWLGPAIVAAAIVGLTFRIVTELLDDAVLGFTAATIVLGTMWFRYLSMVIMSHTVVILLGLTMIWAYLRWRQSPRWGWIALMGALAGWAAITRPVDAICYTTPVAIAVLWRLARDRRPLLARSIILGIACAAPFIAVQLIFDKGVTGHFLKTPYQLYTEYYSPNLAYGSHAHDRNLVPQTVVVQKQIYDAYFNAPATEAAANNSPIASWFQWKFGTLMTYGLANLLLIVLVPVSLLSADRREAWVLWGVLFVFIGGYAFFAFLLPHYTILPLPATALTIVLGIDALRRTFPAGRARLDLFLTLSVITLSITSLSEFTGKPDDYRETPLMRFVAIELPKVVQAPAVVLFHYTIGDDVNEEPVFNLTTCAIDDAPIIRAHDLGPKRNPEIFDYYARRQPQRVFYLFDRHTSSLSRLGTAQELAEKYPLK